MSVSPYTMETLYRQGSIDYIPYDALTPIAISPRNLSREKYALENSFAVQSQDTFNQTQNITQLQMQELQSKSQAPLTLYPKRNSVNNNYVQTSNYNDAFSYSTLNSPLGEMSGSVVDELRSIKSQKVPINNSQDSFSSSILSEEDKKGTQKPLASAKIWPKAFISLTAIILTLVALFKGGKALTSSSFWSKLNPKNWFI